MSNLDGQKEQTGSLIVFVEQLIREKGINVADPQIMAQLEEDLLARVEDRINATILEKLPKEKLAEFNALLDSADSQLIQDFCQHNIADLDEVLAQALLDFRNTYLNS